MTARRILGSGPASPASIGAAQADLLEDPPGVRLPDLAELRAKGVLEPCAARPSAARCALGADTRLEIGPSDTVG
ncbi:hypothetical protein ACOZCI_34900 [Streptomyces griseoincarnatus]